MATKKMQVLNYTVAVHPAEEGGFWAELPALKGCFTQGETIEEIAKYAREAIECYIAGLIKDGKQVPIEKVTRKSSTTFSIPLSVSIPQFS